MNQKGNSLILIILLCIIFLVIVLAFYKGYLVFDYPFSTKTSPPSNNSSVVALKPTKPTFNPSSQPTFTPLPSPVQGYCPSGFLEAQTDVYTICYPVGWTPKTDTNVEDQYNPGSYPEKDVIEITRGSETISVIPSFSAASGIDPCAVSEKVVVANAPTTRVTAHLNTNNNCTLITGISDWIDSPKFPHFFLGYNVLNNAQHTLTEDIYKQIEQSLQIK